MVNNKINRYIAKSLIALVLTVFMTLNLTGLNVFSEELSSKGVISSKEVHAGDTFDIEISIVGDESFKSIAISDFSYDSSAFELQNGKWNIEGILQSWDQNKEAAVIAFRNNTPISGNIFTLTFRAKEDASIDVYTVECKLTVSVQNVNGAGSTNYTLDVESGTISLVCDHTFGSWSLEDEVNHVRRCTKCGEKESRPHKWNTGSVSKPATHLTEGLKVYSCSECSGMKSEVIPKIAEHDFGAWEPMDSLQHKRICECGEIETGYHVWDEGKTSTPSAPGQEEVKTYTCIHCGKTKTETVRIPEGVLGDINLSGTVTGEDVGLVLQHLAGWELTGEYNITLADVSCDGTIDGNDTVLMLQYIAGWFEKFPNA